MHSSMPRAESHKRLRPRTWPDPRLGALLSVRCSVGWLWSQEAALCPATARRPWAPRGTAEHWRGRPKWGRLSETARWLVAKPSPKLRQGAHGSAQESAECEYPCPASAAAARVPETWARARLRAAPARSHPPAVGG